MKKIVLLWCWAICCNNLMAQSNQLWLTYTNKGKAWTADRLALLEHSEFGLGIDNDFNKLSQATDDLGFTHYRYQQTYHHYPVEGALLLVHENQYGLVYAANGNIIQHLNQTPDIIWTEQQALDAALRHTKATKFAWQDEHYQKALQQNTDNPTATFYPKGQLVWVSNSNEPQSYELCYKFDIFATEPLARKNIFVAAKTGLVVTEHNLLHDADQPCIGTARYSCSNPVSITADNQGSFYRLRESSNNRKIETYTANNGTAYAFWDITSADNNFNEDPTATAVHWATEKTYDYFKNTHNRNSFDNTNGKLMSWVHFDTAYDNAFWNGSWMTYGDGSMFSPLVSTDVVGHEIAHGITQYTANLTYSYEPGALNESFSDIFGTVVEFYADPTCADWKIGEDLTANYNGGQGIRNMQNPNSHGQPDTYLGSYWYTGNGDNGGVHYNSGVQNYWFYLLCQGGSGTNDHGTVYNVNAIGMTKAARIVYRMLSTYLTPTSYYSDARTAAIQAATDVYGASSTELTQVVNAWCAVGVGSCTLNTGTIAVTSPNGGEVWQAGSTQNITWTSTGTVTNVDIYYSTDGGSNWNFIANQANTGSYTWTVANTPTTLAQVRVTNSSNPSITDDSNANFTIQGCNVLAGFSTTSNAVCVPTTLTFTNTSTGATTYEWKVNNVTQSTSTNFSYNFTTQGTYSVQLIATNGSCSDTYTQTITVNPAPDASFTHTEAGLIFNGFAVQLSADSYTWDFGDGSTSTSQNATHTYTAAGTYSVCLTVVNGCGSNSECINITIEQSGNNCMYYNKIIGAAGTSQGLGGFYYDAQEQMFLDGRKKINAQTGEVLLSNISTIILEFPIKHANSLIALSKPELNNWSNNLLDIAKIQDDLSTYTWSKQITITNTTRYLGPSAMALSDNSMIISGWRTQTNTNTVDDLGMIRIDTMGNIIWANYYDYGSDDQFGRIINDGNDNTIAVGVHGGGNGNIVVSKIASDGTHLKTCFYNKGNNHSLATPSDIIKTIDGGYAICVQYVPNLTLPTDPHKIAILKIDQNFALQWVKNISYNNQLLSLITGYNFVQSNDGNYYIGTLTNDTPLIFKLDASGNLIWSKYWLDATTPMNISRGPNLYNIGNDIVLMASTQGTSNVFGTNDLVISRTDANFTTLCTSDVMGVVSDETWTYTTYTPSVDVLTYTVADITPTITTNPVSSQSFCTESIPCSSCPTPQFTTPTTTCSNTPYTFTNTSTGATTYQWKVNGSNVSTATNLTYTFPTSGTYTVLLEASNGTCTDTYSQTITVSGSATQLELGSDILQCDNGNNSITIDCGISGALWYNWDLNGTLVGTTQSITATQSGTYHLSVMDACNQVGIDSISVLLDDDCVWPGDVNYDNIVNYLDILPIGLNYGASGSTRPNANFAFNAQPCQDWSSTQANGQNLKHADCNGNGIIDNNDPAAIQQNYSQTHGIAPANPVSSTSPIALSSALGTYPPSFGNSTIIRIDIYLNNSQNLNVTTYGLGFDVNYQFPNCVKVNNAYIDFTGSWLGTNGDDMSTVQKNFLNSNLKSGHIEVGMTRLNHQNRNGYGKIGTLVADVDLYATTGSLQATATINSQAMTVANGNLVPIGGISGSFNITNPAAPTVSLVGLPATNLVSSTCPNQLSTTVSNCNACTYQWKRNGNTISGATTSTYTATQIGTYTVVVSNSSGFTSSASINLAYNNAIVNNSGVALPFCTPTGINSSAEYIKSVQFGAGAANITTSNNGYGDFTCTKVFSIPVNCPATLTLQPKFVGTVQTEYWTVWIDKNMDGDFVDMGEQIWQKTTTNDNAFSKTFLAANIPSTLLGKNFRMRVAMKRGNYATSPCENFAQGEVEDYTLRFVASNCKTDATATEDEISKDFADMFVHLFPNPVNEQLSVSFIAQTEEQTIIRVYDIIGHLVFEEPIWCIKGENTVQVNTQQLPKGIYLLQINSNNAQNVQRFVKQ